MTHQERFEKETGWSLVDEPFSSGPFKAIDPDGGMAGYYDWAHRYIEWLESKLTKAEGEE